MIRLMECRVAYMRPGEIIQRLHEVPVVFLPVGPLEWHGPHLPLGVDPINAEEVALNVCREVGGVVWPTLFWGTERERSPEVLEHLGLDPKSYVVGMDFPGNKLPSAYCPEEVFGLIMRETFVQAARFGAKIVFVINGHGAVNHQAVLHRLAEEFTRTGKLMVHVRMAMPQRIIAEGAISHAGGDETSLMMRITPESVDLRELPQPSVPLHYADFAIVDGKGFDGNGPPDHCVEDDPRKTATAERGAMLLTLTVREVVVEVIELLNNARIKGRNP